MNPNTKTIMASYDAKTRLWLRTELPKASCKASPLFSAFSNTDALNNGRKRPANVENFDVPVQASTELS